MAPQGLDIQFSEDRLDQGRNFMNKLWNSSRFIFMNLDDNYFTDLNLIDKSDFDFTDLWILSKFNTLILDIDKDYKNYKLNDVIKKIYNFIWKDYCDWYIEFSKSRIYGENKNSSKIAQSIMVHVLKNILKILHPYAPFITEEIWSNFNSEKLLINASWPKCEKSYIDNNNDQNIELLMEIISAIRNMKIDLGISPKKRIDVFCRSDKKGNVLLANELHLKHLLNINKIEVDSNITKPSQSATIVIKNLEIFLPLQGLIDFDKELSRLKTKMNDLESRMNNIKKKLDNENFISKAPKNVVDHEKNKYQSYMNDFEKIKSNYLNLNK